MGIGKFLGFAAVGIAFNSLPVAASTIGYQSINGSISTEVECSTGPCSPNANPFGFETSTSPFDFEIELNLSAFDDIKFPVFGISVQESRSGAPSGFLMDANGTRRLVKDSLSGFGFKGVIFSGDLRPGQGRSNGGFSISCRNGETAFDSCTWVLSRDDGEATRVSGGGRITSVPPSPIPLPAAGLLLMGGLGGLSALRRRKRMT